jgi:hypothetical protein
VTSDRRRAQVAHLIRFASKCDPAVAGQSAWASIMRGDAHAALKKVAVVDGT